MLADDPTLFVGLLFFTTQVILSKNIKKSFDLKDFRYNDRASYLNVFQRIKMLLTKNKSRRTRRTWRPLRFSFKRKKRECDVFP